MKWNDHSKLKGTHAFLSASKPGWQNKTPEELIEARVNSYAQAIGTLLHAYAAERIQYREKLTKGEARAVKFELIRNRIPEYAIDIQSVYPTLMNYVNDAIGFGLDPEVLLWYSDESYGTADAINLCDDILRIHDLKTGTTPAKMEQLMTYAAWFYLEYRAKPEHIRSELRIYQSGEILAYEPEPAEVREVMDKIVSGVKVLQSMTGGY